MPKLKTGKSLKRRLRVTGTGKIMRAKIGGSHLRRKKSKRTKLSYSGSIQLHSTDAKRIKRVFPAG